MSDLTEFLLARIAEDEDVARGAYRDSVDDNGVCHENWTDADEAVMWGDTTAISGLEPSYLSDHIARHDPARVLAECEAKRAIVAEHPDYGGYGESCATCAESAEDLAPWPCPTLRAIALPYADHPDYRDEWRP